MCGHSVVKIKSSLSKWEENSYQLYYRNYHFIIVYLNSKHTWNKLGHNFFNLLCGVKKKHFAESSLVAKVNNYIVWKRHDSAKQSFKKSRPYIAWWPSLFRVRFQACYNVQIKRTTGNQFFDCTTIVWKPWLFMVMIMRLF